MRTRGKCFCFSIIRQMSILHIWWLWTSWIFMMRSIVVICLKGMTRGSGSWFFHYRVSLHEGSVSSFVILMKKGSFCLKTTKGQKRKRRSNNGCFPRFLLLFFTKKVALSAISPIKSTSCLPVVYSCANFRKHIVASFVKMAKTMFQSTSLCCIFFHVSV